MALGASKRFPILARTEALIFKVHGAHVYRRVDDLLQLELLVTLRRTRTCAAMGIASLLLLQTMRYADSIAEQVCMRVRGE